MKLQQNIMNSRTQYAKYYGNFRGVDLSSPEAEVADNRLAYAVNVYKDYHAKNGLAVETIPGFRRRFVDPEGAKINGIHTFRYKHDDGEEETMVLVHAGTNLYKWDKFSEDWNVTKSKWIVLTDEIQEEEQHKQWDLIGYERITGTDFKTWTIYNEDKIIQSVKYTDQSHEKHDIEWEVETNTLTVTAEIEAGTELEIEYVNGNRSTAIRTDMQDRKSVSYAIYNRMYILDGAHYLIYDGETVTDAANAAYIPKTRIGIVPLGDDASPGEEYEQANILSNNFINEYIIGSTPTSFTMQIYPANADDLIELTAERNGEVVQHWDFVELQATIHGYSVDGNYEINKTVNNNEITYSVTQEGRDYTYGYRIKLNTDTGTLTYITLTVSSGPTLGNVTLTVKGKPIRDITNVYGNHTATGNIIAGCTIIEQYEDRIFLSGNKDFPNVIFFNHRDATSGVSDPTYWGQLNYTTVGTGQSEITGLIRASDSLLVLKNRNNIEATVYYLTSEITNNDIIPIIYRSTQGIGGIGCIGGCCNFLDDMVFVSDMGLSAVGSLSIRLERALEHRSTMIDAELTNEQLQGAQLLTADGWLWLFQGDKVYLADSRGRWQNNRGEYEYEWFKIDGICVYEGQTEEYRYMNYVPQEAEALGYTDDNIAWNIVDEYTGERYSMVGQIVDANDTIHAETEDKYVTYVEARGHRYLVEPTGAMTGGTKKSRTAETVIDGNIYFGTENGVVCCFNFDRRSDGKFGRQDYDYDGRTIICGAATKMDNCGIPHLEKSTIRKSMVVDLKTMNNSRVTVRARTNREGYREVGRISATGFDLSAINAGNISFDSDESTIAEVDEQKRRWIKKQIYVASNEYRMPFALYSITYRYIVAGRYRR